MKISIVCIWVLLIAFTSNAQKIEILKKGDSDNLPKSNDFAFLENKIDTSSLSFIATYKASISNNEKFIIMPLFNIIAENAIQSNANCFKFRSFTENDSTNISSLILDTYYANVSTLNDNFALHEKNTVYIFGSENKNGTEFLSFKINDKKINLKSGTFFKQAINEGEELKINKGGFTGMTAWITYKKDKPASFFTLTGLGLGGIGVANGSPVASFNTGRIYRINGDIGHLLAVILK